MDKIIINTMREEALKITKIKGDTYDLLKNSESIKFVKAYEEYFNTTDSEKMREFFDKTGLSIIHIYSNGDKYYYFTELGSTFDRPYRAHVFNHDLIIVDYVEKLEKEDNKLFADDKLIYELKEYDLSKIGRKQNGVYQGRSAYDKLKILNYEFNYHYEFNYDEVKQVEVDSFGKALVLLNNGDLYCEYFLYDTDVREIFRLTDYEIYLIYKDNSCSLINFDKIFNAVRQTWNKIMCIEEEFIAFLEDGDLDILIANPDNYNEYVALNFKNVIDIEYECEMHCDYCGETTIADNIDIGCPNCSGYISHRRKNKKIKIITENDEIILHIPDFDESTPLVTSDSRIRKENYFAGNIPRKDG